MKWGLHWNNQQWEKLSSYFELLTFLSVKNIITSKMFQWSISILTKKHFLVEDILVRKTFQHNVLQAQSLIIWEHSALSNVSNAKLVLLGVWLQQERWISAGSSLAASSCCWSGKIRNMLAEPGQLLRWPNPGKSPCLGNIINLPWSDPKSWLEPWSEPWPVTQRGTRAPIAAEGSWGTTGAWLVKAVVQGTCA